MNRRQTIRRLEILYMVAGGLCGLGELVFLLGGDVAMKAHGLGFAFLVFIVAAAIAYDLGYGYCLRYRRSGALQIVSLVIRRLVKCKF